MKYTFELVRDALFHVILKDSEHFCLVSGEDEGIKITDALNEYEWISVKDALPEIPDGKFGIKVLVAWFDKWYDEDNPDRCWEVSTCSWDGNHFLDLYVGQFGCELAPTFNEILFWKYMPSHPKHGIR
jgi:hypothetical protein